MSRAGLPHMVPLERLGAADSRKWARVPQLQQGALTPQFSGSPVPPEVLRPRGPSSCSGYS